MNEIQSDINTLINIDNAMTVQETQPAEYAGHVMAVEKSLSEFVQDSFNVTRKDYEFNQKIQNEVANRLDQFSNTELIALLTNNKVNDSDRLSKLLAPSFNMLTARLNAEISAASQERQAAVQAGIAPQASAASNMKDLNSQASKEVLQGFAQLQNIINAMVVTPVEVKNDDEPKQP